MYLVPCVKKTILGQVVRERLVPRKLAEEIPHLRLVAPYQLAERVRVLARHDACNELVVLCEGQSLLLGALFRPARNAIQQQVSHADRERESGTGHATTQRVTTVLGNRKSDQHEADGE